MAIKINFDTAHNPEEPTFILAKKNGDKLGKINAIEIEVSDKLNDAPEISFTVNKYANDVKEPLWDEIVNFRLVYCVEWNKWFEITVELDESAETKKTVSGTSLGQAELSQINLYNIQINTEDDIARDAYVVPTVLYRKNGNLTAEEQRMASKILKKDVYYLDDYKSASLLHRITEKCPHYSIVHVDETIAHIQRTFEFNETSIYDAFQDIASEINCLFVLDSDSDENGNIRRTISVYDLESNCIDCGHRDEFTMICPKCGSKNINEGYGDDTGIFVSSDELAESIQLSVDTDQVKNCFKLEGGDDLLTSAVRICNPNGSDYIWYITDATKKDMSKELVDSIAAYDKEYARYYNEVDYYPRLNADNVAKYNKLVEKYNDLIDASSSGENDKFEVDEKLSTIPTSIVGYQNLMNIYYDTIDFNLYLKSSLMPTARLSDTDAKKEVAKLIDKNIGSVGASNLDNLTATTASSLVLSMAKVIVDYRYKVEIAKGASLNDTKTTWSGKFIVTNYSDEKDTAESELINVTMTADPKTFTEQKLKKTLAKGDDKDVSISGIFEEQDLEMFKKELEKYSLARLTSFHSACQSCIDIMTEQGISDKKTWSTNTEGKNLYDHLYMPYYNKLAVIEAEMNLRSDEIKTISGEENEDGTIKTKGMMNYIEDIKSDVQDKLNFEKSLGEDLWCEMCSFRREDKYSNSNYTSDGLNNAQLIKRANEFIEEANKDIYKSAEQQHSISADLNNLLVIEKFKPLVKSFEVGNFIRVMIDDELYKLRLIEYTIDYDDIEKISVDFSDAVSVASTMKTVKDVLDQASSMATSYDSVKRQAEKGSLSNVQLSDWVNKGLSLTNMKIVGNADNQNITWDSHGILCREYMPESDDYNNKQLKIINRGLYTTTDNWETTKAGIGNFIYYDPIKGEEKEGYGVIADTLVSNLILSEDVGIYNKNNSITLNKDGFVISTKATGDTGANDKVFTIQKEYMDSNNQKKTINLMHVDNTGNLVLNGSLKVDSTTLSGLGETATNYLTYENGVLKVGASGSGYTAIDNNGVKIYNNSSSIPLASFTSSSVSIGQISGQHVYIDNDSVDIMSGSTVSSSFSSSLIELGKNSSDSVISLCGGKGSISFGSRPIGEAEKYGLVLSSDNGIFIDGSSIHISDGFTEITTYRMTKHAVSDISCVWDGDNYAAASIYLLAGDLLYGPTSSVSINAKTINMNTSNIWMKNPQVGGVNLPVIGGYLDDDGKTLYLYGVPLY